MSYGKQAILSHKQLEKNNDNKELVVANCGYFIAYNSPSGLTPKDDNNCYLLIYLHRGTLTLQSGNKQTKHSQGCVVLFHPNEMRNIAYCNDDINERYYIFFKGRLCEKILKKLKLFNERFFVTGDLSACIPDFISVINDFKVRDFENELFRSTRLLKILTAISETVYPIHPQEINTIQSVVSYINENYMETVTLESLSIRFNISISSLNRGFKKLTGQTPIQYLNDKRLENAKLFLLESSMPISEVSYSIGIQDSLYFSKLFKSKNKVSPKEYRIKHKQIGEKND